MAPTPVPPREGEPFDVVRFGTERGPAGRAALALETDQFSVTAVGDATALMEVVEGDWPGPECILLGDADPTVDPLAIAERIRERDPELPIVFCPVEADTYGPKALVETGIRELLTQSDLSDQAGVRETVADCASGYRRIVRDRQDASLLSTMLDRLPVHAFAKDRDARHVRVSSARYDPDDVLSKTDFEAWPGREEGDESHEDDRRVLDQGESIHNKEEYAPNEDSWFLVSKVPWDDDGERVGLAGLAIDITEQKQREEELQATGQLLSTIVETSPAAIVVHATDGTVQYWNPAAAELFGWSAEEAIRQPYPPYVTEETRGEFHSLVERVLETGSIGPQEVRRRRKDGQWLDLQLSAATLDRDSGDPERIVTVMTDVTALKERERRVKRQNDRIEQFTRVLAHDLRNPVQVIRGQLDRGKARQTDLVERALDRIEAIVDDVLSVARSDPLVTETETVSLSAVARDVWEHTDSSEATLSVESDCTLDANRARLYRLLDHLFDNALTHGGDSVTITVGCLEDGFFVEDDGDGIAPEHLDHVFEPGYSTVPNATGFGLNVVREITEAHDWSIDVAECRDGARFEIRNVQRKQTVD